MLRTRQLKARLFKIGGASLAYVPMLGLAFGIVLDLPARHPLVIAGLIFNIPAFAVLGLLKTYHLGGLVEAFSAVLLVFSWSSLMAWFFWRAVGTFQGDDEPECQRGRFDWDGFQVRFFCGFVVGFLVGWRFVKHSTSMKTLLVASLVTGVIGGFIFGISRPRDFWSRP